MSSLRWQDTVLTGIANLQKFDGSFNLDQNLATVVKIPLSKLQQDGKSWNSSAWATVVVLAFFVAKLGDVSADWELLADKSKSWLSQQDEKMTEDMFEKALNLNFPN